MSQTTVDAKRIMKMKISGQTTAMLLLVASQLKDNFEEGSCIAFSAVLDEIEKRLPEQEFIALCDML